MALMDCAFGVELTGLRRGLTIIEVSAGDVVDISPQHSVTETFVPVVLHGTLLRHSRRIRILPEEEIERADITLLNGVLSKGIAPVLSLTSRSHSSNRFRKTNQEDQPVFVGGAPKGTVTLDEPHER